MEYLRRLAQWFVSGVGLALGAAVVVFAFNRLHEPPVEPPVASELPVQAVALSHVEPISISDNLAMSAELVSLQSPNIAVELQLSVSRGGKMMFQCPGQSFSVAAVGKPERVQVDCRGVQRRNVPPDAATEMTIRKVTRLP